MVSLSSGREKPTCDAQFATTRHLFEAGFRPDSAAPPPPSVNHNPTSRIIPVVLLAALSVLAVSVIIYEAPAAFADHSGGKEVWSATLTISGGFGCNNVVTGSECSSPSVLTDDDFVHGGVNYAFIAMRAHSGGIQLSLDKTFPEGIRSAGTLYVDGSPFNLADANFPAGNTVAVGSGLFWSTGDTIQLRLTEPYYYGVEISGGDLDTSGGSHYLALPAEDSSATFQIRLTADRGTTTAVNLDTMVQNAPHGAPGHNWNYAAVTITPKTVTFTPGSTGNWSISQNVTVTGVPDGDNTPEQLIILALPDPMISGEYINGFHVTVADGPGVSGASGGAFPESPGTPVITLAGFNTMNVPLDSTWTDPGYTATDSNGNDITASVTVTGMVDTSQEGTYLLYYQVADSSGIPATPQIRTVNVVAPEPEPQTQEPQPEPEPQPQGAEPEPQPQQGPEPEPKQEPPQEEPEPEPTQEPEQEPTQEPEQEPTQEPEQEPTQEPEQEPTQEPEQEPTQEPEPEPTQEPEQEPADNESDEQQTCDIPAIVRQYDTDGSCVIERDEWERAVDDYVAQKLNNPQIQTIAAARS